MSEGEDLSKIKQQNIQVMVRMIIDKLYNNTLQKHYQKLSKEQGVKIEAQKGKIAEQGVEIDAQKGEIAEQEGKIAEQEGKIAEKEGIIAEQEVKISDIEQIIRSSEAEIESKREEIEGLRERADGNVATQNEITKLTTHVKLLKLENSRLQELYEGIT